MPPHLSGCGSSDLPRNVQRVGEDRQLAGLGLAQVAVHAEQVAEVELLGQCPAGFADLLLADIDLNPAGPILEVEEKDLAHATPLHDPAGGTDPLWGRRVRRQGADVGDALMAVKASTPGIQTELFETVQFLGTADFEVILRC